MTGLRPRLKAALAIVLLVVLSTTAFVKMDDPLLPLFLFWAVGFNFAAVKVENRPAKILFLNIGLLSTILFVVELGGRCWGKLDPPRTSRRDYKGQWWYDHPILGYGPKAGASYRVVTTVEERVLYDVEYHYDDDALRVSPSPKDESRAILFFGGSFTLGEGVEDHEAFPYLVGEETGIRTLNFGFHGYGPHQMLAALQSGLVEDKLRGATPTHVVHLALESHVERAVGLVPWSSEHGPYFQLLSNRRAVQNGKFSLPGTFVENLRYKIRRLWFRKLRKSFLGRRLLFTTRADRDLWAAIVNESRLEVQERWPEAKFHVFFIDSPRTPEQMQKSLDDSGVSYSFIFQNATDRYKNNFAFSRVDRHPTVVGHRLLAEHVLKLLGKGGPTEQ